MNPVAIEVQGIGWPELEGSWVLLYDNKFTGFMSAITTGGTARFTLTATGPRATASDSTLISNSCVTASCYRIPRLFRPRHLVRRQATSC